MDTAPTVPAKERQAVLEVRSSRAVGAVALGIGGLALGLAIVWEPLRTPFRLSLFGAAVLIGFWGLLDRRLRLSISAEGIRYADWGRRLVPWREFSAHAWTSWRRNPYLQLIPHRPSELARTFSPIGRFNHFAAGLMRMPLFAIAVTPLAVSEADLDKAVARHLPRAAPPPVRPG